MFQSFIKDHIFTRTQDPFSHYTDTPLKQHWCKNCGDKFIFKSSYNDHLFRDTVKIVYACKECRAVFQYSNRCSLLSHIRSHIKVSKSINMSDISVEPSTNISVTLTDHYQEDEEAISMEMFESLKSANLITITDDYPPFSSSIFFEPPRSSTNVDNIIEKLNKSFDTAAEDWEQTISSMRIDNPMISCTQNGESLSTLEFRRESNIMTAADNLSAIPNSGNNEIQGTEDDVILCDSHVPGEAERNAQAQEVKDLYECRDILEADDESSSLNVMHGCNFCLTVYPSKANRPQYPHYREVIKHIFCEKCNMHFSNPCSYKAHQAIHTLEPPFVCPECGVILLTLYSYYNHVIGECFHLTRVRVYSCISKSCGATVLVSQFTNHFMDQHVTHLFRCLLCPVRVETKNELSHHSLTEHQDENAKHFDIYYCRCCFYGPTTRKTDIISHIQQYHQSSEKREITIYRCPGCLKQHLYTTMKAHATKCEMYINSNYRKHISKIKDFTGESSAAIGLPPNFIKKQCLNCKILYIFQLPISDNIELTQCDKCVLDKKPLIPMSKNMKIHRKILTKKIGNRVKNNVSSKTEGRKTNKRKKVKHNKKIYTEGIGISYEPSNGDGYKCAKCQFVSQDKEMFANHVISHKVSSAAFQCMDCGISFVTKGSLSCHLIISHSIKDTDKYISENKCQSDTILSEFDVKPADQIKENQCEVCMDQFQSSAELNKHFRIHGMAFLLAKKKNKAT